MNKAPKMLGFRVFWFKLSIVIILDLLNKYIFHNVK